MRKLSEKEIDRLARGVYFVCPKCTDGLNKAGSGIWNGPYGEKHVVGGEVQIPFGNLDFVEFEECDGEPGDDNPVMKGYGDISYGVDDEVCYAGVKGDCPYCGFGLIKPRWVN